MRNSLEDVSLSIPKDSDVAFIWPSGCGKNTSRSDGDFFGDIALLKIVARTATIKTPTPTVLLTLSRSAFHQTLTDSPALREELERVVTQRN